jgi:intracellular septation protein A
LRTSPRAGRAIELRAFLFAVRPIATDLAATLVFYAVLLASGNVRVATALGIGLGLAQLAFMTWRRLPIAPMQWVSLVLVVTMGGLTLITDDPRFVLVKVSIFYCAIGAAMLQPGWIYRYVPPIAVDRLPRPLVVAFGFIWAALIIGTGILNLALTFTVSARTVAGVMAIWAPSSKILLFVVQYLLFRAITRRRIIAALREQPIGESA